MFPPRGVEICFRRNIFGTPRFSSRSSLSPAAAPSSLSPLAASSSRLFARSPAVLSLCFPVAVSRPQPHHPHFLLSQRSPSRPFALSPARPQSSHSVFRWPPATYYSGNSSDLLLKLSTISAAASQGYGYSLGYLWLNSDIVRDALHI